MSFLGTAEWEGRGGGDAVLLRGWGLIGRMGRGQSGPRFVRKWGLPAAMGPVWLSGNQLQEGSNPLNMLMAL